MHTSVEQIGSIIEKGEFEKFITLKEGLYFEAKQFPPYDFEKENGRLELAKDVSAMANAVGGYIIIGLKTDKMENEKTDYVKELDLIKKDQFQKRQYEGIIKEYIYPNMIDDITVGWNEDCKQKGKGVGYIYIERKKEEFYLIQHESVDGERLKHIYFGYAERKGDKIAPLTKDRLHKEMKKGRSKTVNILEEINEKLNNLLTKNDLAQRESPADGLKDKISEMED